MTLNRTHTDGQGYKMKKIVK